MRVINDIILILGEQNPLMLKYNLHIHAKNSLTEQFHILINIILANVVFFHISNLARSEI